MPDTFGQETPQEAIARVRGAFSAQNARFQNSNAANQKGARAGQALANIFGGVTKKFLDTRRDRKSEAERLVQTTGVSVQEAREMAKKGVPFGHSEVRRATQFKKAASDANDLVAELTAAVGPELARASGMLMQARNLREMGFAQEATNMTLEAGKIRQAEEARLLGIEETKAKLAQTRQSTRESEVRVEDRFETDFTKLTENAEILRAKIETETDPAKIPAMERELGLIDSQIYKRNLITGTTEFDPSNLSKAGRNKVATDILDGDVLLGQLGDLESILLSNEGNLAASWWGRAGEKSLGFAEEFFGRVPSESEQDFMERVRDQQGSAAFIAADIRHALTGAAMSPAEAVFLEPFLPLPTDARSVMLNKIRVVQKYTRLDRDIRQALLDDDTGATARKYMTSLSAQSRAEKHAETTLGSGDAAPTPTQGTNSKVQQALDASAKYN